MNKVHLIGRLTRAPQTTYPTEKKPVPVTTYTLAVNSYKKDKVETAYVQCVAFGKMSEFAEIYFYKGIKIAVTGHISTGRFKNREGRTVFTTNVVIETQEFAESPRNTVNQKAQKQA